MYMWEQVSLGRSCHVVAGLCVALSSEAAINLARTLPILTGAVELALPNHLAKESSGNRHELEEHTYV
jgi:hypothetical protein